jgi:hypothetical protein
MLHRAQKELFSYASAPGKTPFNRRCPPRNAPTPISRPNRFGSRGNWRLPPMCAAGPVRHGCGSPSGCNSALRSPSGVTIAGTAKPASCNKQRPVPFKSPQIPLQKCLQLTTSGRTKMQLSAYLPGGLRRRQAAHFRFVERDSITARYASKEALAVSGEVFRCTATKCLRKTVTVQTVCRGRPSWMTDIP